MTGEQTPVATEADFESLRRKLHAVGETLTPAERSILQALLLRATGEAAEGADVEGFWSIGVWTPFGTVSADPTDIPSSLATSILGGLFGVGSSPSSPTAVHDHRGVRDHRTGGRRDHR